MAVTTLDPDVRSPSNAWDEMEETTCISLAADAHKVWVCEVDGTVRFFGPGGELDRSPLAPTSPARISL